MTPLDIIVAGYDDDHIALQAEAELKEYRELADEAHNIILNDPGECKYTARFFALVRKLRPQERKP